MDCSVSSDTRKILKLIDNNYVITQGRLTLLDAAGTALNSWYQIVDSYGYQSVYLAAGATASFNLDANFILIKIDWASTVAVSDKTIEVLLPEVSGSIGSTIPFPIGGTGATYTFTNIPIRDIMIINSVSDYPEIQLNNISDESCTVNIMTAKSY